MAARVQIIVEAKDATSGVLRAITGQLGAMGGLIEELTSKNVSWGSVAERAATLVFDSIKDTIQVTQQYAEEVRDLTLASGTSAEEASRFIQVLDDYQLSADDAKTATRALTKEGLAPTVETLVELSRQYNELSSAEEKNAFVQKNLGRAGQEWLNLLAQGPDKIRAMNAAVDESLILTEENIRAAEEYRLALDSWQDSITGVKIKLGNELLPVLADSINVMMASGDAIKEEVKWYEWLIPAVGAVHTGIIDLREARENNTISIQDETAAMMTATESLKEQEELIKETTTYYKDLISSIQNAQAETDRYTKTNDELLQKKRELNQSVEALTKKYGAESEEVAAEKKKLADLSGELDANAKAHQRWAAQTVFAFAQARAAADGEISKGEGEVLIAVGEQLGLFDEKTAQAMKSVNESFDDLDASNAKAVIKSVENAMYALTNKTWVIKISTDTSNVTLPGEPTSGPNYNPYDQQGGTVYAGAPSRVGEAGSEWMIPEVNGRVLGHAESLKALSMGGGANYFYGPVTIEAGSETGGDLMSMR